MRGGRKSVNQASQTLLSSKKLLAFRGGRLAILGISLFIGAAIAAPRTSEASILASLAKFFGVSGDEVEETVIPFITEIRAAADSSALSPDGRSSLGASLEPPPFSVVGGDALLAPMNPGGSVAFTEGASSDQIFLYRVRIGDTLSSIAKSFGVSVNTILWANAITNPRSVRIGQELLILPVSGVQHEVVKGDTVASIAKKYRASVQDILDFNGLVSDERLALGAILMIPDGEMQSPSAPTAGSTRTFANLPVYDGYYLRPILGGRRSRGIHGLNGVDLANSCGLPVMSSADGIVLVSRAAGWNGGYGNYVVISHANSTQTLYSHMKNIAVSVGEAVRQGEVIGSIGSTGNSTGCHVHFEVRGARNPF